MNQSIQRGLRVHRYVAGPDLLTVKVADGVATEVEPNFCAAIAGLATVPGAYTKYTMVTRAGVNQGFALAHLHVRGERR